ncbi:MAG: glycosyltransferase [Bdellovibrionales bacterium]|nr:glycosyltransferase [Bdellovibrionales bacterium]
MKKATIIILSHISYDQVLDDCLRSLDMQDTETLEIEYIVLLNGYKIEQSHSQFIDSEKFKFLEIKKTSRSVARNLGSRLSSSEILGFLDSHVEVPREWIKSSVDMLTQLNVDAVQPSIIFKNLNNYMARRFKNVQLIRTLNSGNYLLEYQFQDYPSLDTSAIIFKRETFLKLKGFDEAYDRFEDRSFGIRMITSGEFLHGTTKIVVTKNFGLKSNYMLVKDHLLDMFYSVKCSFKELGRIDFSLKYLSSVSNYSAIYFKKAKKNSVEQDAFHPHLMNETNLNNLSTIAFVIGFIFFFRFKFVKRKNKISELIYLDNKYRFTHEYHYWSCDENLYFKCEKLNLLMPLFIGKKYFQNKELIKIDEKDFFFEKIINGLLDEKLLIKI